MSLHLQTLSLTIRPAGRLGWVLTVNGTPYAHGMQAYCIRVDDTVRREFSRHGWAAFPDLPRKRVSRRFQTPQARE